MKILLTGGTGFLGTGLRQRLSESQHQLAIFSRQPNPDALSQAKQHAWFHQAEAAIRWQPEVIINLSGASLFDNAWSSKRWQVIRQSRIGVTEQLLAACQAQGHRPKLLLSGSAIGYYGDRAAQVISEQSSQGQDQSAELCRDWEQAALAFTGLGCRVALLRTGLVMHPSGGALKQILPQFKLGLGGPLGMGRHYWSWISLNDWLRACEFLLTHADAQGPFNLCAPEPLQQKDFAKALGQALHRPAIIPAPSVALRLALGTGRASLLLSSQRVLPMALQQLDFEFEQPDWPRAAQQMFS